jgi:hypothetical protein
VRSPAAALWPEVATWSKELALAAAPYASVQLDAAQQPDWVYWVARPRVLVAAAHGARQPKLACSEVVPWETVPAGGVRRRPPS